jgi:hypothetical protein
MCIKYICEKGRIYLFDFSSTSVKSMLLFATDLSEVQSWWKSKDESDKQAGLWRSTWYHFVLLRQKQVYQRKVYYPSSILEVMYFFNTVLETMEGLMYLFCFYSTTVAISIDNLSVSWFLTVYIEERMLFANSN